jgi:hypothetical protein
MARLLTTLTSLNASAALILMVGHFTGKLPFEPWLGWIGPLVSLSISILCLHLSRWWMLRQVHPMTAMIQSQKQEGKI